MPPLPSPSIHWRFLSDGFFSYPRPLLGIEESGADVELPYRSLFLEVCGRRILIDTGAGPLSPTCGTLAQNLAAVVPLDSIEMVFLTHAHPDHIGGLLLPDGNPAFPNAEVWLSGREWDYWKRLSRDGLLGTGEVFGVPALEELTHQWLERYLFPLENRALRLIGDEVTLAPGVRSFACPGHTPGHMALEIGEHFLYAADLVYRPEQLADLNTATRFDWDREALTASRRTLIAQARQQERPLVFCHVLTEQVPR